MVVERLRSAWAGLRGAGTPDETVTFVLCIENNAIRAQALMLCESIRLFAGRHRKAPIVAVAARPGFGIDEGTRARLRALDVEYVEEPLNAVCPEYGSANRVFAAAWAEARTRTDWIVVLDSDTVFLREPELPAGFDVAVRPVDSKGSATAGPGDPFEDYWARLAALEGVSTDCLPFVQTTDRRHRVRASYNGGLIVCRRASGILGAWADLFSRSIAANLRPWRGRDPNVHASTGYVGTQASELWGSNQAALALAIWSRTPRVRHYPPGYNVPLHLIMERPEVTDRPMADAIVHLHYHWMFTEAWHARALIALGELGVEPDHVEWLRARIPLR